MLHCPDPQGPGAPSIVGGRDPLLFAGGALNPVGDSLAPAGARLGHSGGAALPAEWLPGPGRGVRQEHPDGGALPLQDPHHASVLVALPLLHALHDGLLEGAVVGEGHIDHSFHGLLHLLVCLGVGGDSLLPCPPSGCPPVPSLSCRSSGLPLLLWPPSWGWKYFSFCLSELKFQVWFDSLEFKLRYKVSNMMSLVGLGLGLVGAFVVLLTGFKDQLRLINTKFRIRSLPPKKPLETTIKIYSTRKNAFRVEFIVSKETLSKHNQGPRPQSGTSLSS